MGREQLISEAAQLVNNQWYCAQMVSHFLFQFLLSPHQLHVLKILGKDTISLAKSWPHKESVDYSATKPRRDVRPW